MVPAQAGKCGILGGWYIGDQAGLLGTSMLGFQ